MKECLAFIIWLIIWLTMVGALFGWLAYFGVFSLDVCINTACP